MANTMKCCICNKMAKTNLVILNTNICAKCEREITRLKVSDKKYFKYREGIKTILESLSLKEA